MITQKACNFFLFKIWVHIFILSRTFMRKWEDPLEAVQQIKVIYFSILLLWGVKKQMEKTFCINTLTATSAITFLGSFIFSMSLDCVIRKTKCRSRAVITLPTSIGWYKTTFQMVGVKSLYFGGKFWLK